MLILFAHVTPKGIARALVGHIASEAGEVLAAVQTAMLTNLPYSTLRDAVLVHPTIAEGLGPLLSNVP